MVHINDIDASFFVSWLIMLFIMVSLTVSIIKLIMPIMRKLEIMLDDFTGEPERPGVPRRKGIMERMESIELRVERMEDRMERKDNERKNRQ